MIGTLVATLAALPGCPGVAQPKVLAQGLGSLESVIVDRRGRLFVGASQPNAVLRFDTPGAPPKTLAPVDKPGGMVLLPDGDLVVGQGDGFQEGAVGNLVGLASLLRIDPDVGTTTTLATGLRMANGLARDRAGRIYASDDVGTHIERVTSEGLERNWAAVVSANGLAIDAQERFLYAAQTFQPAAIKKVDLADPSRVSDHYAAPADEVAGGPDGMTIDERDRLYVAVNAAGEVWRIDPDGTACTLASGLVTTSAVALGEGGAGGHAHANLYVVGFDGRVLEIPTVRPPLPPAAAAPPRPAVLHLAIRPRSARAGRRTRYTLTASSTLGAARRPVRTRLRFAGRTVRTDSKGRARITLTLGRGRYLARFRGRGPDAPVATVTVR